MKYEDEQCTDDCQTCGGSLTNKECSEQANRSLPLLFLLILFIIWVFVRIIL